MERLDLDDRAKETLLQMMRDWGAPECETRDKSVAFFRGEGRSALVVVADPKLKESEVVSLLEATDDMCEVKHRSVVITRDPKKRYKVNAAVFLESELFFNRARHMDAQEFHLMSVRDVDRVCEAYRITVDQLPRLAATDPQARYWGLSVGEVVKIARKTENGDMTHYRRVVAQ